MHKIGIIGGGNMGEAIIGSVRKKYSVSVAERDSVRSKYLRAKYKVKVMDLPALISSSDILIIAVKPQDIETLLKEIYSFIGKKLIISIAAGITTSYIEKILGKKIKVIRAMPNMPAMIGEGITAVSAGKYSRDADIDIARNIFDCLGKTVVVKENLMDAVTAVSGSGQAYVFFFLECMMKSARALGLAEDLCQELVTTTFLGSIHLLEKQNIDPGILRAKVTSKGGTTQAALEVFEKNHFADIMTQALKAAQKRAAELSRR